MPGIAQAILLSAAVFLSACRPLPDRSSELCDYAPPGTQLFAHRGDWTLSFANLFVALMQDTAPDKDARPRMRCGSTLSAQPESQDAAIVAAISATLGEGWLYQSDTRNADVTLHRWQTTDRFSPTQYFALATYRHTLTDTQGQSFRPLESFYLQDNPGASPGRLVSAIVIGAVAVFCALLVYARRRRRQDGQ